MHGNTQAVPVSGRKFAVGALIVVAVIVVIGVAASNSNGNSNRIKGSDLAEAQFEGFADQICKCEDRLCQREVLERMDKFQRSSGDEIKAMSREQNERVDVLFKDIEQCVKTKASTR